MDVMKHESESNTEMTVVARCCFGWLTLVAEILLAGSLGLILYWVFNYHGGVAFAGDGSRQMNLHYVLMVAGFTFMNGHAMLVYRMFPCCKKIYNKIIHMLFFLASAACIAIGLYAAIDAHNEGPKPVHFYSMHSWIGLAACGLFALQFVTGFFFFLVLMLCDSATAKFRQTMIPTHVTFGLIIFVVAAAATLTGLTQSARYRLSGKDGKPNYKDFPEQGIVVNVLAMCIIASVIIVPYIIRNSTYGRYTTLTIN
ncbi:cytochrome b reductase 1 [Trichonephila clavata]|uniref:Cytochrome b reductase 1 n=1 Tax=Trichonephila clavata TaxID=2740835 RepID=A0A8X6FJN2_TRICU|nr:cytochrome b reductase 1 [Trichonephila clavata]